MLTASHFHSTMFRMTRRKIAITERIKLNELRNSQHMRRDSLRSNRLTNEDADERRTLTFGQVRFALSDDSLVRLLLSVYLHRLQT